MLFLFFFSFFLFFNHHWESISHCAGCVSQEKRGERATRLWALAAAAAAGEGWPPVPYCDSHFAISPWLHRQGWWNRGWGTPDYWCPAPVSPFTGPFQGRCAIWEVADWQRERGECSACWNRQTAAGITGFVSSTDQVNALPAEKPWLQWAWLWQPDKGNALPLKKKGCSWCNWLCCEERWGECLMWENPGYFVRDCSQDRWGECLVWEKPRLLWPL